MATEADENCAECWILVISMYYKRYENQWRFNIFFSGSILAGSFSGLLAYAIAHMDGVAGYAGWRWVSSQSPVSAPA